MIFHQGHEDIKFYWLVHVQLNFKYESHVFCFSGTSYRTRKYKATFYAMNAFSGGVARATENPSSVG